MKPTDEQEAILDAFDTGEDICIEAGAGTGKSTQLRMIARRDLDLSGLLLSFNVKIAEQARSTFPGTTACMTSHSLAMRSGWAEVFRERIDNGDPQSKDIANWLGIRKWFPGARGRKDVSTWKSASLALETVRRFCQSDDDELLPDHVPYVIQVERHRQKELKDFILPFAERIWEDVKSDQPELALGQKHLDHALKLFALSKPILPFDFLMVDEAQDTNDVLAGLVRHQSGSELQVIVVGDSSQQMYRWRGAGDFLTDFDAPHRLTLTQSFRFGEAVAEEANNWLRYLDAPIRLKGLEAIPSTSGHVEDPRAVLCRTNAEVVEQAMLAQAQGVSVGIIGKDGGSPIASFAQGAIDLQNKEKARHRELSAFETWNDVVLYVAEEAPGGSFSTYVRLIERYGARKVLEVAERCVPESEAERCVGTCHAVKGLEYESVLVDPGVLPGDPSEVTDPAENKDALRICYVAVTRAQMRLDAVGLGGYHRRRDVVKMSKMRRAMMMAVA